MTYCSGEGILRIVSLLSQSLWTLLFEVSLSIYTVEIVSSSTHCMKCLKTLINPFVRLDMTLGLTFVPGRVFFLRKLVSFIAR